MPTLAAYIQRTARDLGDEDFAVYSEGDIQRALERAVEDLNRFLPRERYEDISISDLDVTDEAFTTDPTAGVHKALANTNLQSRSETTTLVSDGSGLSRGTDYEIDYIDGTIAWLAGSTKLTGSDAITVSYKKDRHSVDISSLSIIRIERVEYRAGSRQQSFSSFDVWGGRLIIVTVGPASQDYFDENTNIIVWYTSPHTMPSENSEGTIDPAMAGVIQHGAFYYALMTRALVYRYEARTSLTSAAAAITSIAAVHTAIATEQTELETVIDLVNSTLDGVSITSATGDLTAAATAFAAAVTALGTISYTNMETDLASVDTRIDTQMDAALVQIETDWAIAAEGVGSLLIGTTNPSAKGYLDAGDAFLEQVNLGESQSENYALYARETARIVEVYVARLNLWRDEAQSNLAAAQAYVGSAQATLAEEANKVADAQTQVGVGQGYVASGNIAVTAEQVKINQALGYAQEVQGRIQKLQARLDQIDRYLGESLEDRLIAEGLLNLADDILSQAVVAQTEYFTVLRERVGFRKTTVSVSVAQPHAPEEQLG